MCDEKTSPKVALRKANIIPSHDLTASRVVYACGTSNYCAAAVKGYM